MPNTYDAIIIGAGHNGLVTAAYLARAGRKVLVLERRDVLGGCCITEELWPGFKVSTAAYVNSLLRPEIIRDLDLKKYGFEMLPRSPSSFTPFPDGRYLMMGPDREMTLREIAKFSQEGRRGVSQVRGHAHARRRLPRADARRRRRPTRSRCGSATSGSWSSIGWKFRKLGRHVANGGNRDPHRRRPADSRSLVRVGGTEGDDRHGRRDRRVRRRRRMPGTAYVLFHHVMGECNGVRGVWGYVRGGMGMISNSIASGGEGARRRDPHQSPRSAEFSSSDGRVAGRRPRRRHRVPAPSASPPAPTPTSRSSN